MQETRIFKDNNTFFEVELDQEELIKVRDEIIDKMSVIDHFETESPDDPYYSPNKSEIRKRGDIQIRNYREWSKEWIDVYELCCSSYDRYTIPYLSRLINGVLNGNYESLKEIKNISYGREYIPIRETIEEYSRIIAKYKEYHTKFPRSPLCHEKEARVMEKCIMKYINIMLDDTYANKFREYYEKVSEMISVKELEVEVIEKDKQMAKTFK